LCRRTPAAAGFNVYQGSKAADAATRCPSRGVNGFGDVETREQQLPQPQAQGAVALNMHAHVLAWIGDRPVAAIATDQGDGIDILKPI